MIPELVFLTVVILAASISSAVFALVVREEGNLPMMVLIMIVVFVAFTLSVLPFSRNPVPDPEPVRDWWSHHLEHRGG